MVQAWEKVAKALGVVYDSKFFGLRGFPTGDVRDAVLAYRAQVAALQEEK
jgi:hypothetical protein